MQEAEAVQALAALAQPVRLRAFRALVQAGAEGLTPGALAETLQASPSALSFHLKELLHAGLVTQQRQGRHLIYRAAYDAMDALLSYLTEQCCGGQRCAAAERWRSLPESSSPAP
ncbi:ArsR/SmtB family transcription factor [Tepidimonas alkaliphilus]|nr:metalloregulator ArsR/SmtB family transcription factor [Tepidimonas alkaliphilus]